MQLSIDTQRDSHAEIRKAIRMLMSLVGEKEVYTNEAPKTGVFNEEKSPAADAFAGMFGSNNNNNNNKTASEKEEKKEIPEGIELY